MWKKTLALVAVALTAILPACAHRQVAPRAPSSIGAAVAGNLSSQIYLDNPYDRMHFDPPAGNANPSMSADRALAKFEAIDPAFIERANTTAQLGNFTDGAQFNDVLTWGYSWHECAPDEVVNFPSNGTIVQKVTPSGLSCTRWLFLKANTGNMMLLLWQHS
jgi:hypothetical protein